jgi:hypothetical protein
VRCKGVAGSVLADSVETTAPAPSNGAGVSAFGEGGANALKFEGNRPGNQAITIIMTKIALIIL